MLVKPIAVYFCLLHHIIHTSTTALSFLCTGLVIKRIYRNSMNANEEDFEPCKPLVKHLDIISIFNFTIKYGENGNEGWGLDG